MSKAEKIPFGKKMIAEKNGAVGWMIFNNPQRHNALSLDMWEAVPKILDLFEKDPKIRVVVLKGAGDKAFISGADISEFAKLRSSAEAVENYDHVSHEASARLSKASKPTIAMINGAAVGSGMDMSLHCDIRIGCEKTRFIGYQQAGQIMENGGSYYLPKMVGLGRALEFAYTGSLNAERAYEWGLLNHLVASEDLEKTTRELCDRIIALPPLVQWTSKRIMRAAMDSTLETTMVLTSNAGGILQSSADAKEARQAFVEKRKPEFKGV